MQQAKPGTSAATDKLPTFYFHWTLVFKLHSVEKRPSFFLQILFFLSSNKLKKKPKRIFIALLSKKNFAWKFSVAPQINFFSDARPTLTEKSTPRLLSKIQRYLIKILPYFSWFYWELFSYYAWGFFKFQSELIKLVSPQVAQLGIFLIVNFFTSFHRDAPLFEEPD